MKEFIEKLIGRLDEYYDENEFETNSGFIEVCKDIVNELAESYHIHCEQEYMRGYEDARRNDGWIPCSERLPKLYENTSDVVLVCGNNNYQHMAFWCSDGKWRYCQSGMIKEPMDWIEIVAWQPLPDLIREAVK